MNHVGGKLEWCATVANSLEDPQNVKKRTTIVLFRNPTSEYFSKRSEIRVSKRYISTLI